MSDREKRSATALLFSLCLLNICGLTAAGSQHPDFAIENKINRGIVLRQQGNFQQAISVFDDALTLARFRDNARAQLECIMNLGILYWDIGEVKDSDEIYRQALGLSQKLGLKDREAQCAAYRKIYKAYVRGKEARAAGTHQVSIAEFQAAIELARKMNSPEHELKCLRQLSLNYHQLEKFSQFYMLNRAGLEIAQRINHKKEQSRCLNNIGVYYYKLDYYSRALMCFDEALSIMHELSEDKFELSACLNNIGLVYRELGYYEKAFPHFEMALEMDQSLNNEDGIAIDLSNLGAAYHRKGRNSGNQSDALIALSYYLNSFAIAKNGCNRKLEVDILNNIGLVYATLSKNLLAMKYFQSAMKEAEAIGYIYETCNIGSNIGYVLMESGVHKQAQAYFRKAIKIAGEIGRDEILWEAYFGLGRCFENEGRYESALTCYEKAVVTIETMRSRVALDDYKTGFVRDKMKAYDAILSLLYERKQKEKTSCYDAQIFAAVERAKARSFLEELGQAARSSQDSGDSDYRDEQTALSRNISLTISKIIRSDLEEAQRKRLLAKLELEEDAYTSLLNRIKTERAEYSQLPLPVGISAPEIQDYFLDEKSAILEYYLGDKRSFGILLTKNSLIIEALPSRAEVEDSLKAFLKMLSTPPNRDFQGVSGGRRIYKDLISPFEHAFPSNVDHLVFIPDGILYYLPFETLVRDDTTTSKPRYLIELYDISYAPSVSSLVYLKEKERKAQYKKTLLAVGAPAYLNKNSKLSRGGDRHKDAIRDIYLNDGFEVTALPYSKKEVHRVARCFPDDEVDLLSESRAKEEVIKSWPLEEYRILHFACHGFLDERTSMRSALVLTLDDDPEEDGFLQAREISDLRLDADLVVLSACQTGKGRLENAEGVLGLPRTFFYAGARSIISSLWKINDKSTAELMPEFYRSLAAGNNKARSLRLAKLNMLKSRFSHPFYWAAFVLNGDYLSADH
jgi:CHAT domain-containing protein/Tfp pilus assembly protein PilF